MPSFRGVRADHKKAWKQINMHTDIARQAICKSKIWRKSKILYSNCITNIFGRGVFRTLSDDYDGAFLRKYKTDLSP